ncbi:hypothetical protein CYLTODRAFT_412126 [Cylindrobasidium torrendii FP15055 ss-10]|uniref:RNI-like protein n=1 Tax=Cylindrobasidium torrendii FP15055 ss-10 TaxID=1314674 RepID=A0A0D7B654_9AGAR|nr:hypothetical protein CYLTODRAFT_412126 [Cylindrobasidium torrendii FP15055 ss-10]
MPKLWRGPSFSLSNGTSFQRPGRMALMASRSQPEPLTLDIDFKVADEVYGQLAFEELGGLFPRVQSLFLQGVPAVLDAILHSDSDPLEVANLQSLSVTATLTGEEYLVANSTPSLPWASILSPFQDAVLDNLCLLTSCDEGYGFNQVSDISILGLDLDKVTTLCFDTDYTPSMLEILQTCPSVTSLSILCSLERSYQIPHTNVEMLLHLDTLLLENMSGLMRSLNCPQLRHLTLSDTVWPRRKVVRFRGRRQASQDTESPRHTN